jgi:hypothetical protein
MEKLLRSAIVCLLIAIGVVAISGCCSSSKHKTFYTLTGKYTPENTSDFERGERLAKGSNHRALVFFIPFGTMSETVALDDAVRKYYGPVIALENITIDYNCPFMFGAEGYTVRATAILKPSGEPK